MSANLNGGNAHLLRRPRLVLDAPQDDDDTLRAVWPEYLTRYLFADGSTRDVITWSNNSDLTAVLVEQFGDIKGSVTLSGPTLPDRPHKAI